MKVVCSPFHSLDGFILYESAPFCLIQPEISLGAAVGRKRSSLAIGLAGNIAFIATI
jgi:hypothetical protein